MDPPVDSVIYTIGVQESRIRGFCFLDPPRALGWGSVQPAGGRARNESS